MPVKIVERIGQTALLGERINILGRFSTLGLNPGMGGGYFGKMVVSGSSSSTIDGTGLEHLAIRSCLETTVRP
jgi:hypothetical protein